MTDSNPELASVNSRILAEGECLPAVTLKDGSRVQTGTVAAMLQNVARYNRGERGEVERALELAVPTLVKVGLFELFSPQEWAAGDNPGRRFVGLKAQAFLDRGEA
ncbi:hypothetical protein E8F11_28740 [Pseudomonas sp. BN417]|uniref:DUF7709 family protein n=1 Tax=Pseudomonas sp. BN417 TaxID=2567890 RepID=UPI002454A52B|nr:hypothetical protein [Pseudomonas sp. BN417]MDH4559107.1 hypothetical protein [Pseudomonas sp. BN417]